MLNNKIVKMVAKEFNTTSCLILSRKEFNGPIRTIIRNRSFRITTNLVMRRDSSFRKTLPITKFRILEYVLKF